MKDFAPMVASVFVMLIPIIAILTRHQQKMTLLMRQENHPQQNSNDLYSHQYEVQQLKSTVSDLAMSVDSLRNDIKSNSQLQERVKIGD